MIKAESETDIVMRRRRVTLKDGRYLIFYTFTAEGVASGHPDEAVLEQPAENGLETQRSKRSGDV
jgi:hypothetical protein